MTGDKPQPAAVWYFPPKRSKRGQILLVIGLSIVALLIAAAVVLFLVTRGGPAPGPTETPTPQPTVTASPSPSHSETPSAAPSPTPTEQPTQAPPAPEPEAQDFRAAVAPRLDDAATGLGFAAQESGQSGVQVVETLLNDAEWLSDHPAPPNIADDWSAASAHYIDQLSSLRSAFQQGADTSSALSRAEQALNDLRHVAGL